MLPNFVTFAVNKTGAQFNVQQYWLFRSLVVSGKAHQTAVLYVVVHLGDGVVVKQVFAIVTAAAS
jgi:hypothetical protein